MVPTRSQDIFNANTGLQCFLYCSANKLGTRPFDSRSLKNDKKNIRVTTVTKLNRTVPFNRCMEIRQLSIVANHFM